MKRTSIVLESVLIVATALLLASCNSQPNAPYGTTPTPQANSSPNTVVMANLAFTPSTITVAKGTTVTWKNADAYAAHTATSDTPSWDTGNIPIGASKTITFSVSGTYPYHCLYHGTMGMTGTVVVQ